MSGSIFRFHVGDRVYGNGVLEPLTINERWAKGSDVYYGAETDRGTHGVFMQKDLTPARETSVNEDGPAAYEEVSAETATISELINRSYNEAVEQGLIKEAFALPPAKGVDPKAAYGATKPSVALVPSAGLVLAALAAEDGAKKYGGYNYREGHPVEVMTYAHAAMRHLQAFIDGEDFTSDTGVPNLGGVIMCCDIIADIMATGVAVDNRPKPGPASKLQDAGKEWKRAVAAGENPVEAAKRILGPAMGVKP